LGARIQTASISPEVSIFSIEGKAVQGPSSSPSISLASASLRAAVGLKTPAIATWRTLRNALTWNRAMKPAPINPTRSRPMEFDPFMLVTSLTPTADLAPQAPLTSVEQHQRQE